MTEFIITRIINETIMLTFDIIIYLLLSNFSYLFLYLEVESIIEQFKSCKEHHIHYSEWHCDGEEETGGIVKANLLNHYSKLSHVMVQIWLLQSHQ